MLKRQNFFLLWYVSCVHILFVLFCSVGRFVSMLFYSKCHEWKVFFCFFFLSSILFAMHTICIQCVQLTGFVQCDKCEKFTMLQATATNNDLDDESIHARAALYAIAFTFSKHKIFVRRFSINFKMLCEKVMVSLFEWDTESYHKNYFGNNCSQQWLVSISQYVLVVFLNAKYTSVPPATSADTPYNLQTFYSYATHTHSKNKTHALFEQKSSSPKTYILNIVKKFTSVIL